MFIVSCVTINKTNIDINTCVILYFQLVHIQWKHVKVLIQNMNSLPLIADIYVVTIAPIQWFSAFLCSNETIIVQSL